MFGKIIANQTYHNSIIASVKVVTRRNVLRKLFSSTQSLIDEISIQSLTFYRAVT